MVRDVVLDDRFVREQLKPGATLVPPLLPPTGTSSDAALWRTRRDLEREIDRCLELFDRHRGLSPTRPVPEAHRLDRVFLNYSIEVVGQVLGLGAVLPIYRRIIEIDWLAHVELEKEKRYRDHVTHPVRVTAIGWWLLHRENGRLLKSLAEHYQRETRCYRAEAGVDAGRIGWETIVEHAWLACGLLHDSAYPLEYHLRAGEGLRAGYDDHLRIFAPATTRFSTVRGQKVVVKPLSRSWLTAQGLDLEGRMKALARGPKKFRHAHALLGPLHHLLGLGRRLHSLQGLVVQLAARAIVTHHDANDAEIEADPLALLLFVADNLQGWQRPFLDAAPEASGGGPLTLKPIVECSCIVLVPEGEGFVARFRMNESRGEWAILKGRHQWKLSEFSKPNQRLERLLARDDDLPSIVLSEPRCIQPPEFLEFMER